MKNFYIIALRMISVLIAGLCSVVAIKVFLAVDPRSSSTFMAVLGWTIFLPLFQLGLGRPCYAELRSKFLHKRLPKNIAHRWLCIFRKLAVAGAIVFGLTSILIGKALNFDQSYFLICSFSLLLASLSVCIFQRDIAYALDNELPYEIMEILRRLALGMFYVLLYFKYVSGLYALMLVPIAILTWIYTEKKINENSGYVNDKSINPESIILNSEIKINAKKNFGFTINELILYNIPLIIFTLLPNKENIIYFVVWNKLFLILVIGPRIFIDSMINAITKELSDARNSKVLKILNKVLLIALAISLFILMVFFLNRHWIYDWLSLPKYIENDIYFFSSLFFWVIGNNIQHCYGTFTISRGDGFGQAFKISTFSVFFLFISISSTYYLFSDIGLSIFISGIAYCLCSTLYIFVSKTYLDGLYYAGK